MRTERNIANTFFTSIGEKQSEVLVTMIEPKLVTPATTDQRGRTPLVAATAVRMCEMILPNL